MTLRLRTSIGPAARCAAGLCVVAVPVARSGGHGTRI